MTAAIIGTFLALLGALAPTLGKMVGAWFAKRQARESSGESTRNEIDTAIKNHDAAEANRLLQEALRRTNPSPAGHPPAAAGVRDPKTGDRDPK